VREVSPIVAWGRGLGLVVGGLLVGAGCALTLVATGGLGRAGELAAERPAVGLALAVAGLVLWGALAASGRGRRPDTGAGAEPPRAPAGAPAAGGAPLASAPTPRSDPDSAIDTVRVPPPRQPLSGPAAFAAAGSGAVRRPGPGTLSDDGDTLGRPSWGDVTQGHAYVARKGEPPIPSLGRIHEELQQPGVHGYLVVVGGPDRGRSLALRQLPATVGRGPMNELALNDKTVSKLQATVALSGGRLMIKDAGSRNGTFVNNQQISTHYLQNCDIVGFGDTRILVATA
jgi:hypothetical protein